jgi:hypothetical protein
MGGGGQVGQRKVAARILALRLAGQRLADRPAPSSQANDEKAAVALYAAQSTSVFRRSSVVQCAGLKSSRAKVFETFRAA